MGGARRGEETKTRSEVVFECAAGIACVTTDAFSSGAALAMACDVDG
jgi:hypothetical protein